MCIVTHEAVTSALTFFSSFFFSFFSIKAIVWNLITYKMGRYIQALAKWLCPMLIKPILPHQSIKRSIFPDLWHDQCVYISSHNQKQYSETISFSCGTLASCLSLYTTHSGDYPETLFYENHEQINLETTDHLVWWLQVDITMNLKSITPPPHSHNPSCLIGILS